MGDFWDRLLPEGYDSGEFPGESLPGEMVRRITWRIFPKPVLHHFWKSVLLGEDGFWCFILGVNNSGTTLLDRLLGRHPSIRTLVTEGQFVTRHLNRDDMAGVPRLWTARRDLFRKTEADDPGPALRALHDWGFQYISQRGKVLLEKSPPNALRSRWLQAHFTRPRFIVMFRHPCAVAEGIRRREGHDLRDAARHWNDANKMLLDDLSHIESWTEVRYEELCERPMETMRRLLEFLDLPPTIEPGELTGLDVHSLDESVDTVENFNPRSFERLSGSEMEVIAAEAREVAEHLGYAVPPDRDSRDGPSRADEQARRSE